MPRLPAKRVGLISCSGEDLPEGTVSRMATLKVLEELRPGTTVTLCLPLFLAGEERERAFARFYPTIAVDGCDKRCAARATERYSAAPAAGIVVSDLIASRGLEQPRGERMLDGAGALAAEAVAAEIAGQVDRLLDDRRRSATEQPSPRAPGRVGAAPTETATATCSCGSSIAVGRVEVGGRAIELVALPSIFALFREEGRRPGEDTGAALFDMVATYNRVPASEADTIRDAVLREYAAYLAKAEDQPAQGTREG